MFPSAELKLLGVLDRNDLVSELLVELELLAFGRRLEGLVELENGQLGLGVG